MLSLTGGLVLALAASFPWRVQPAREQSPSVTIHVNQPCDSTTLTAEAVLTGSFGWNQIVAVRGTPVSAAPQDISFPTANNGQTATGAVVIVYCRGYRLGVLRVPSFADATSPRAIDLVPLGTLPLRGRVTPPQPEPAGFTLGLSVDITDIVLQLVGHTGGYRGPAHMIPIVETAVKPDGTFEVTVPDFKQDPLLAPGFFVFTAGRTRHPFLVESPLPFAASYPNEVQLRAVEPRGRK